mgnify:CR=1 FL=1
MKLEDIGFYTLENTRAMQTSSTSPLWRCELILTSKCNFSCPYCRGTSKDANITFNQAKNIVNKWCDNGLKNIRFSGGEPTMVRWLPELIEYTNNKKSIERIAISTNGSKPLDYYQKLFTLGVNDFSISLDGCCSAYIDKMSGRNGYFDTIKNNIMELSKITYVTVGCVFNKNNVDMFLDTICFADSLGVSDIRIVSSAQHNKMIETLAKIPDKIKNKYPILKYRINNYIKQKNVRGIKKSDCHKCYLMLDDMAIKGENHYPCIIKMREGCAPIGKINNDFRNERLEYFKNTNTFKDKICRENCLDVCIDYNNIADYYHTTTDMRLTNARPN